MMYHLYAIEVLAGATLFLLNVLTVMVARLRSEQKRQKKEQEKVQEAIKDGLMNVLRSQLIDRHERYVDRGSRSTYGYESYLKKHQSYRNLGGNGMIEELLEEIRKLPLRDKEKPKNEIGETDK